jgi:hypothetical protein
VRARARFFESTRALRVCIARAPSGAQKNFANARRRWRFKDLRAGFECAREVRRARGTRATEKASVDFVCRKV